jgi:hypothetical protein
MPHHVKRSAIPVMLPDRPRLFDYRSPTPHCLTFARAAPFWRFVDTVVRFSKGIVDELIASRLGWHH